MTLVEQIDYINKIKDKVLEIGAYDFITPSLLTYVISDINTKVPVIYLEQQIYYERKEDTIIIHVGRNYDPYYFIHCSLEDFLSTYFYDMVNPSPEEKVMWKLQFGFDWYF